LYEHRVNQDLAPFGRGKVNCYEVLGDSRLQMFLAVVLGVFGFIVLILAVYVGGNWLLGHLGKPKPYSEEAARRYKERLLNPCWKELEEYFNQAIPERIKHFYTQTEIINRRDLRVTNANGASYHIAQFLPADMETLNGIWPDVKESTNFPLATDAFGDCYYIPLNGEKSAQCPVMCYHHDGSDVESVSTSLDEFVHRLEKTRLGSR
jgi:hypothetical protein